MLSFAKTGSLTEAYACAQVAKREHVLTEQVCQAAASRSGFLIHQFRPQTLSSLLWALATMQHQVKPAWLKAAANAAADQIMVRAALLLYTPDGCAQQPSGAGCPKSS